MLEINGEARDPRRRRRIIGILLIVLAVLVVVPSVVKSVLPFVDSFTEPTFAVPGQQRMHLSRGSYTVYQRTGSTRSAEPLTISDDEGVSISPAAVTVTASDGTTIPIHGPGYVTEEITRGSTRYTGAARFTVPHSGDYDVRISDVASSEVIVVRSLWSAFRDAVPWMAVAVAGATVFMAGVVLLIVSLLSRSPVAVSARVSGSSPPGWYADPSQPGRLRYWNGTAWTTYPHPPT